MLRSKKLCVMKVLLMLPFIATLVGFGQSAGASDAGSPVEVIEFSWSRERRPAPKEEVATVAPVRSVISENKNFQRTAREQNNRSTTDVNDNTIDGRSAALEKINQQSRSTRIDPADGYIYRALIRNSLKTRIEVIFLEFQFTERRNPKNFIRRQFLCVTGIDPGEKRELLAFSSSGPSDVVNADSLTADAGKPFDEQIVINRIEYGNGAILQRDDWDYKGLKDSIDKAAKSFTKGEICRPF